MDHPQIIEVKELDPDVLRKSITKGDRPEGPLAGGVWHFLIPAMGGTGTADLTPYWTPARDWTLYQTIYREAQWANSIAKAISKITAKSLEFEGPVPLKVKRAREMLLAFDLERGWVPGLAKHMQAFLLTCNGAFIEVVHQTGAPGSKVLGLVHLDSFRCIRTGDPERPLIYRDRRGGEHILKDHQVIMLSDMPDQAELWNGVGHCAAERAFPSILRMEAIERYLYEKVSGRRPLAIHLVNASKQQISDGVAEARAQREAEGMITYMGAVIIPITDPTATPAVATIDVASIPEGFVAETERKNAYLVYANAIGIDPQMIDPSLVGTRSLGTGTQARVLAEKQEALGLAAWDKAFTHEINEKSLDERTTFFMSEIDLTDQERRANISLLRSQVIQALVTAVVLSADQGMQLLVDWDEVPEEFLPVDQTSDTTLTDEIKPEGIPVLSSEADIVLASARPPGTVAPADVVLAAAQGGGGSEADVVLAAAGAKEVQDNIRHTIDKAINRSYRLGMKHALDTAAMQELISAVKSLASAEAAPQVTTEMIERAGREPRVIRRWVG